MMLQTLFSRYSRQEASQAKSVFVWLTNKARLYRLLWYTIVFLAFIIVEVLAYPKYQSPATSPTSKISLSASSWLWGSPSSFTDTQMQQMFSFCQQYNIKTIYLEIDDYVPIMMISDLPARQARLTTYNTAVTKFLATAARYGLRVQGLGGNIDWINRPNDSFSSTLLKYILDYNNSHSSSTQFEGMQYDIEFYNLPDFSADPVAFSTKYLRLVQNLIRQAKADQNAVTAKFQLGFATPFAFGTKGIVPQFLWAGQTKPLAYHILDLLNTFSGSYDVLMDYRNYALGSDGSIAHAKDEIDYAQHSAPNASVVVGQDTTDAQPSKTTFYGLGKTALNIQTSTIREAFAGYSVFKGIAIHDLPGYMAL